MRLGRLVHRGVSAGVNAAVEAPGCIGGRMPPNLRRAALAAAALVWVIGWTLTAHAQDYGYEEQAQPPTYDQSQFRQRLGQALMLRADQEDSLRVLRSDLTVQLESLRDQVAEGSLGLEDARVEYRRAMRAQRAGRDEVLTEEQRSLLARARRFVEVERLADPRERRQRPRPRLAEALELTDWQKTRWRELLQEQRLGVQAMREEGKVLSREEIRRLRGEHRSAFAAILTPDQAARLEEIRQDWQRSQEEGEDAVGSELEGDILEGEIEGQEEGSAVVEESWGTTSPPDN